MSDIPISVESIKLLRSYIQPNVAFLHFNNAKELADKFSEVCIELDELLLYIVNEKYKKSKEVTIK